jgi:Mg2+ and Co2+ transporter CorA
VANHLRSGLAPDRPSQVGIADSVRIIRALRGRLQRLGAASRARSARLGEVRYREQCADSSEQGDDDARRQGKAATLETLGEEFRLVVPCFTRIEEARIRDHLRRDQFFWLDLNAPGRDQLVQLREIFGFHPIALEDTDHFGQGPKLDNYDDYIFVVFYGAWRHGAKDPGLLHEVHVSTTGKHLVTIHRDPLPLLDHQRGQLDSRALHSELFLHYAVLDALVDT